MRGYKHSQMANGWRKNILDIQSKNFNMRGLSKAIQHYADVV
jgi:hypothetical protein|tara:strand:+ start:150 stop:275 length:126 start_codon:yes stop_codon:yes gene_type:complete